MRPLLQISGLRLLQWYSAPQALVSAEVVPFRPHRGVLFIVEEPVADGADAWLEWLRAEHYPALLTHAGVAGVWTFGSVCTPAPRGWRTDPHYVSVVYLDDDPLAVSRALAPLVQQRWRSEDVRPVFAGPLRSMTSWDAWSA